MGYKLAYPDVSHEEIHKIYRQSLHKPIHAYAFFIDPCALFTERLERCQSPDDFKVGDARRFFWELQEELMATGLHKLAIATSIPTPKRFRTPSSDENGWLVILGTGFDKTLHVPVPDELLRRVREILEIEEDPAWWLMRWFNYLWITDRAKIMKAARG